MWLLTAGLVQFAKGLELGYCLGPSETDTPGRETFPEYSKGPDWASPQDGTREPLHPSDLRLCHQVYRVCASVLHGGLPHCQGAVKVFSHFGIPEEILTDQGAKFMSGLLEEVY